ncbi:DUF4440 domain-containing protein [Pararhodobacter sp. CCB-MM2]|uniref:DUF4440 domain-containing protein n=1 Tax=Pararhodobacter sp. CCB-MM2 TaxID=1786003 RepID=UPI00083162C9|nr:DUF4440 domain-containing protein [Pararhodobacter sp. CCB-MM2]MCA2011176.1 DUF4440 domain-containing protein [Cereibacter sphaeroides]
MTPSFWNAETRFWLEGTERYPSQLASDAVMVFPAPTGMLKAEAIAESLQDAPRWDSVDFEDQSEARAGDTMVLAYKAIGQRGKERPYVALCSSTYARQAGAWKLLSHQQTPL